MHAGAVARGRTLCLRSHAASKPWWSRAAPREPFFFGSASSLGFWCPLRMRARAAVGRPRTAQEWLAGLCTKLEALRKMLCDILSSANPATSLAGPAGVATSSLSVSLREFFSPAASRTPQGIEPLDRMDLPPAQNVGAASAAAPRTLSASGSGKSAASTPAAAAASTPGAAAPAAPSAGLIPDGSGVSPARDAAAARPRGGSDRGADRMLREWRFDSADHAGAEAKVSAEGAWRAALDAAVREAAAGDDAEAEVDGDDAEDDAEDEEEDEDGDMEDSDEDGDDDGDGGDGEDMLVEGESEPLLVDIADSVPHVPAAGAAGAAGAMDVDQLLADHPQLQQMHAQFIRLSQLASERGQRFVSELNNLSNMLRAWRGPRCRSGSPRASRWLGARLQATAAGGARSSGASRCCGSRWWARAAAGLPAPLTRAAGDERSEPLVVGPLAGACRHAPDCLVSHAAARCRVC
jgi:hypothetical protein